MKPIDNAPDRDMIPMTAAEMPIYRVTPRDILFGFTFPDCVTRAGGSPASAAVLLALPDLATLGIRPRQSAPPG